MICLLCTFFDHLLLLTKATSAARGAAVALWGSQLAFGRSRRGGRGGRGRGGGGGGGPRFHHLQEEYDAELVDEKRKNKKGFCHRFHLV